jgi:CheY-like chemotaxis protein
MLTETKLPLLLLVEDSDDDAFFFKRTFQKSGASCALHHVTDGAQAIDFLQAAAATDENSLPHAIFLDLKMPVLNGFEVLEWIRTQSFPASMQVIVLSGSEHQEDKDRALKLGANDYLVKPITVSDLQRFLREVCPAASAMGAHV